MSELHDLDISLEELQLGPFTVTAVIEVGSCWNELRHLLIKLDMVNYKSIFNSQIPNDVFNFFSTGKQVQGLPQSLQGTLAASEVLAGNSNCAKLHRELNLVYPGSGEHITPLLLAFDLIDRNSIDRANLLLNDRRDVNLFLLEALKKFQKAKIITNLRLVTSESDKERTTYLFVYNDRPVCLVFLWSDFRDVADWKIGGKDPNVVYDHIPIKSSPPGFATRLFSVNQLARLRGLVFHIIPTSTIDVDQLVANNDTISNVSTKRVENVSFADKQSWTVTGQKGVGLTIALLDHH